MRRESSTWVSTLPGANGSTSDAEWTVMRRGQVRGVTDARKAREIPGAGPKPRAGSWLDGAGAAERPWHAHG